MPARHAAPWSLGLALRGDPEGAAPGGAAVCPGVSMRGVYCKSRPRRYVQSYTGHSTLVRYSILRNCGPGQAKGKASHAPAGCGASPRPPDPWSTPQVAPATYPTLPCFSRMSYASGLSAYMHTGKMARGKPGCSWLRTTRSPARAKMRRKCSSVRVIEASDRST